MFLSEQHFRLSQNWSSFSPSLAFQKKRSKRIYPRNLLAELLIGTALKECIRLETIDIVTVSDLPLHTVCPSLPPHLPGLNFHWHSLVVSTQVPCVRCVSSCLHDYLLVGLIFTSLLLDVDILSIDLDILTLCLETWLNLWEFLEFSVYFLQLSIHTVISYTNKDFWRRSSVSKEGRPLTNKNF